MLLFLLLVFILPVIIGLYMFATHQRLEGRSHGELVQPPRKLAFAVSEGWQDKWHLVYVSSGLCDEGCRNALYMMRQVHATLEKNIDRVQRVCLVDGTLVPDVLEKLHQQYPDMPVMNAAADKARQFDLPGGTPSGSSGRVYLVDPLGNLMMSYPRGTDPQGMRKDLKRLLTYSWAG